jgi:hypothetical protein
MLEILPIALPSLQRGEYLELKTLSGVQQQQ